jgi:hypothetical protein
MRYLSYFVLFTCPNKGNWTVSSKLSIIRSRLLLSKVVPATCSISPPNSRARITINSGKAWEKVTVFWVTVGHNSGFSVFLKKTISPTSFFRFFKIYLPDTCSQRNKLLLMKGQGLFPEIGLKSG